MTGDEAGVPNTSAPLRETDPVTGSARPSKPETPRSNSRCAASSVSDEPCGATISVICVR